MTTFCKGSWTANYLALQSPKFYASCCQVQHSYLIIGVFCSCKWHWLKCTHAHMHTHTVHCLSHPSLPSSSIRACQGEQLFLQNLCSSASLASSSPLWRPVLLTWYTLTNWMCFYYWNWQVHTRAQLYYSSLYTVDRCEMTIISQPRWNIVWLKPLSASVGVNGSLLCFFESARA